MNEINIRNQFSYFYEKCRNRETNSISRQSVWQKLFIGTTDSRYIAGDQRERGSIKFIAIFMQMHFFICQLIIYYNKLIYLFIIILHCIILFILLIKIHYCPLSWLSGMYRIIYENKFLWPGLGPGLASLDSTWNADLDLILAYNGQIIPTPFSGLFIFLIRGSTVFHSRAGPGQRIFSWVLYSKIYINW